MKNNKDYRECPKCQHLQIGSLERPQMCCVQCGQAYCFLHANAHDENTSCKEYAAQLASQDKPSEKIIAKISKKCPNCGADTEKNGGCNHMTCSKCSCDWCWLCGKVMKEGHYDPWNLAGCPGGQFRRVDADIGPPFLVCSLVMYGINALVGSLCTVVFGLLYCVFLPCCCCLLLALENKDALVMAIVAPPLVVYLVLCLLLWLSFCALWVAITLPFFILCSPLAICVGFGAYSRSARRWVLAPQHFMQSFIQENENNNIHINNNNNNNQEQQPQGEGQPEPQPPLQQDQR
uniref:RING-type domain-containing protein n=1 Tax=Fibrocapsa japonica TaxID=94617 RepID=A0A7S2UYE8_9STRA